MRFIGTIEVGGVLYQAVWGSTPLAAGGVSGLALAIRNGDGENETVIPRNAKLAEVEASLRHLRGLGIKDAQLSHLFRHKGNSKGLARHVKMLVSSLT